MSNYRCISNFGQGASNAPVNNPLSYCLSRSIDTGFNHGAMGFTLGGADGKHCQEFMAQRCANEWDLACEYASKNTSHIYPNQLQTCGTYDGVACAGLSSGDILIQNTAAHKYLVEMIGNQCRIKYEPFDPTVAASPLVGFWYNGCNTQGNAGCVPVYAVDPKNIDKDPVMNKILNKPIIAWSILINIYNTAKRLKKLDELKGTHIYRFFMSLPFQLYLKEMKRLNNASGKITGCGCN